MTTAGNTPASHPRRPARRWPTPSPPTSFDHGADITVALVVSHAQAEDLADRIRRRLAAAGVLHGPSMTGPGWTIDRHYQAGRPDPAAHPPRRPAARHWSTAPSAPSPPSTTTAGHVRTRRRPTRGLPGRVRAGTRADGTPNVSHAWARTVDGAQGGTWDHAHLLGTAALDAYRGYTAQSRSRHPTHTWNTTTVPTVDHGGRLAHQPDPDDQVAAALARIPDTTMAAVDDPWRLDRQLREPSLRTRPCSTANPPTVTMPSRRPSSPRGRRARMAAANDAVNATRHGLDDLGPFAGLTRNGRSQRRGLEDELCRASRARSTPPARSPEPTGASRGSPGPGRPRRPRTGARLAAASDRAGIWDRLDQHWTDVALACVRRRPTTRLRHRPATRRRRHLTSNSPRSARPSHPTAAEISLPPAQASPASSSGVEDGTHRVADASSRTRPAHQSPLATTGPRRTIGRCQQQFDVARGHLADEANFEKVASTRPRRHRAAPRRPSRRAVGDRRPTGPPLRSDRPDRRRTRPDPPRRAGAASSDQPRRLPPRPSWTRPVSPAGRAAWCHQASRLEGHRGSHGR